MVRGSADSCIVPLEISNINTQFFNHIIHNIYTINYDKIEEEERSSIELDSHSKSSVVARHFRIIHMVGSISSASGFTNDLGKPIKVEVVHSDLDYDYEYTGGIYLMIIQNTLYMWSTTITLLPTLTMRLHMIEVEKCPKFLSITPSANNN